MTDHYPWSCISRPGALPFRCEGVFIWVHERTAEKLGMGAHWGFTVVRWLLQMRVTLVSAQLEVGVRLGAPFGIRMELLLCCLVNLSIVGCMFTMGC